jgi:hypothetical protein
MSYGRRLLDETALEALSAEKRALVLAVCEEEPGFRRDLEWLLAQFRGDLGPHLLYAVAEELARRPRPEPDDALEAALAVAISVPMLELGELFADEGEG